MTPVILSIGFAIFASGVAFGVVLTHLIYKDQNRRDRRNIDSLHRELAEARGSSWIEVRS